MSRRTVLQVIPALEMGGAERACIDVALALEACGARSMIASSGGPMLRELEGSAVQHITLPLHSKNPLVMMQNSRKLAQLMVEKNIQLVHARSRAPAWSAFAAAHKTQRAFVTSFHAAYKFSSGIKKFYNSVMTRGQRVIAISRFIAAHVQSEYAVPAERVRLIPRGIDLTRFQPEGMDAESRAAQRAAWDVPPDAPLILLPGRLSPIKGQDIALQAFAALAHPSAHLVILGSAQGRDEYVAELKALAGRLGIATRVRFAQTQDMPRAYAAATIVLVTSRVPEGFGRVPVEAQAMGKPVIASAIGAISETVQAGRYGWLVPPENPVALKQTLSEVLAVPPHEAAAQAAAARAAMQAEFSLPVMLARTLSVYDEVLGVSL